MSAKKIEELNCLSVKSGLVNKSNDSTTKISQVATVSCTPSKAGQRRLRTETLLQQNLEPLKSEKTAATKSAIQTQALGFIDPIVVGIMILLAAKLEEILIKIEDNKIQPLKLAISEHKQQIIALQQELVNNRSLIEKLQLESYQSEEAINEFQKLMTRNQELTSQLKEKLAQHDQYILQLQFEAIKNENLSQKLNEAILENKEIIQYLLKEVSDIHELQDITVKYGNNADGNPPLLAAIKNGDRKAVELLIKHGADVSTMHSSSGIDALLQATISGQYDIAKFLLEKNAEIKIYHPVHASLHGNIPMIDLFFDYGIDVNIAYPHGPNLLYVACRKDGNLKMVKHLVSLGIDINACGKAPNERTPLDEALISLKCENDPKNLEVIKYLVEHGAKRNTDFIPPCPVLRAYLESVKPQPPTPTISHAAKAAIDKYKNNPHGLTPLNYAIDVKDFAAAEALIEAEIGINIRERLPGWKPEEYEYTPALRLVILTTYPTDKEQALKLVKKVFTKKIDVSSAGNYGLSLGQDLLIALVNNPRCPELLKLAEILMNKYKISPNYEIQQNKTSPVQFALQHPFPEAVRLLVKHGARLDSIDCFSTIAVHDIEPQAFKDLLLFLKTNGANPLIQSRLPVNMTAIDWLAQKVIKSPKGNIKAILPFLQNLGAKTA